MEAAKTQKVLQTGSVVRVVKGCTALKIRKYNIGRVLSVQPLGPEYGHAVKVILRTQGENRALYARHQNRLSDPVINLNTGNPLHLIKVQVV